MVHPRTSDLDPAQRSRLLSRILDPEYSGVASPSSYPSSPRSLRPLSPLLADRPQPSVFVDKWGNQHDPDFRPFGSHPVRTPINDREHDESWPWDVEDPPSSSSPWRSPTIASRSSSSYHSSSSGSRSRSASVLATPTSPALTTNADVDKDTSRSRIPSPAKIPRSALFPWTPAQRAVRVQHEVARRNVIPSALLPEPVHEEEPEIPLALVDSRYVPGYGHVLYPPTPVHQVATSNDNPDAATPKKSRLRSHTVPVAACARAESTAEDPESEEHGHEHQPQSPSCTQSLRQSVYSFGLKTKLGLHHMKVRMRRASSAAKHPLSV